MPFLNSLFACSSQDDNENDFKTDIKLKLNSINTDIKFIRKDITDIKTEMTDMKYEMKNQMMDMKMSINSINNKMDILLNR